MLLRNHEMNTESNKFNGEELTRTTQTQQSHQANIHKIYSGFQASSGEGSKDSEVIKIKHRSSSNRQIEPDNDRNAREGHI